MGIVAPWPFAWGSQRGSMRKAGARSTETHSCAESACPCDIVTVTFALEKTINYVVFVGKIVKKDAYWKSRLKSDWIE